MLPILFVCYSWDVTILTCHVAVLHLWATYFITSQDDEIDECDAYGKRRKQRNDTDNYLDTLADTGPMVAEGLGGMVM